MVSVIAQLYSTMPWGDPLRSCIYVHRRHIALRYQAALSAGSFLFLSLAQVDYFIV